MLSRLRHLHTCTPAHLHSPLDSRPTTRVAPRVSRGVGPVSSFLARRSPEKSGRKGPKGGEGGEAGAEAEANYRSTRAEGGRKEELQMPRLSFRVFLIHQIGVEAQNTHVQSH